jgi:RES domain-containing protein
VTLPADWVQLLDELVAQANALKGNFFRSVELRWGYPDDVISGEGARENGGRFVTAGTRAVYASLDEETAMREATSRKSRLGGASQILLKDYPRMTYVLTIVLSRHVDLRLVAASPGGRKLVDSCSLPDLEPSKAVGQYLFSKGVQGIIFPSVVCNGANMVVSRDVSPSPSIEIENRTEIIKLLREFGKRT